MELFPASFSSVIYIQCMYKVHVNWTYILYMYYIVPCQPNRDYGLDNIDNYMRNIVAYTHVIHVPCSVLYIPVLFI